MRKGDKAYQQRLGGDGVVAAPEIEAKMPEDGAEPQCDNGGQEFRMQTLNCLNRGSIRVYYPSNDRSSVAQVEDLIRDNQRALQQASQSEAAESKMKKEISKLKQDAQKCGQQILDFLTVINQNHQASEK